MADPIKTIFVLEFDLPAPETAAEILSRIDPPKLPYFSGQVRVAIDDPNGENVASEVLAWLDET